MRMKLQYEREYLNAFYLAPVFAMVLVFYAVMHSAISGSKISYDFDQNIRIMEEFIEAEKLADLGIVMIGNSRLRNGATFGFDPKELAVLPDGRKLAAIQYTENAAQYLSFEYLEGYILDAHPDYLLIVDSVLTNALAIDDMMIHYARLVMGYITSLFKEEDYHGNWWAVRTGPEKNCYDVYTGRMMKIRIETTAGRDHHDLSPETNRNIANMRKFIKTALDNGIKVIVLNIPPNMEVLEQFGVEPHILDFYGLGFRPKPEQILPDDYRRVIWLDYKHPNGQEDYCDFVHFNEKGRAIFSEWLKQELGTLE